MKHFNGTLYTCECGYRTLSKDCASKHSKTKKCIHNVMTKKETEFVLEEDIAKLSTTVQESQQQTPIENKELAQLQLTISRLQTLLTKLASTTIDIDDSDDDDSDCESCGLIYFVEDVDIPDRGKVGRTKNTDVKKLKTRYATFASPKITCFYSTDIKKDENDLKKLLRDAECMASNNEKISNCDMAASIFLEFSRRA